MTKQHFIALADLIRTTNSGRESNNPAFDAYTIKTLADFCAQQNPRFNRDRWLGYIAGENGQNGGKVKA